MSTLSAEEQERAIKLATDQIEKQFGKGSIMRLGEQARSVEGGVIPTGSLALDIALGVGGTMLMSGALMGLVFMSSGTGHDHSVDECFSRIQITLFGHVLRISESGQSTWND